ncbi:MAG: DUF5724 domain-containing protein [Planctomycetaceae bacterium]|jgi:hypothetical protein|nr:DUF5724 domain-containing protein [Planctomycetaceae bacterium]
MTTKEKYEARLKELRNEIPKLKKEIKKSVVEKILVQKIADNKTIKYTKANGFGLCDPNGKPNVPEPKESKILLADIFVKEIPRLMRILKKLDELIHKYRNYKYTRQPQCPNEILFDETSKTITLTQTGSLHIVTSFEERQKKHKNGSVTKLEDYVLADVWKKFYEEQKLTVQDIVLMDIFVKVSDDDYYDDFEDFCNGKGRYKKHASDFTGWFRSVCWNHKKMKPYCDKICSKNFRYFTIIYTLTAIFFNEIPVEEKFDFIVDILSGIYHATPKKLFTQSCYHDKIATKYTNIARLTFFNSSVPPLITLLYYCYRSESINSIRFEERFNILYKYYEISGYNSAIAPSIDFFEKARSLNLIDDEEILREMLTRNNYRCNFSSVITSLPQSNSLRKISETENDDSPQLSHFQRLLPKVIDRIIEIELKRGDSPTEVSKMAFAINHLEGIQYFVRILKAMDKTPFTCAYDWSYDNSRSDIFSSLLRACKPEKNADSKLFTGIPKQRLLEAAIYAPQWIDFVQEFLGWEGLTSACWFFHAHTNFESVNETEESMITRYSSISLQELADGKFDIDWFNNINKTLGKKRFQMVYDAAKSIFNKNKHQHFTRKIKNLQTQKTCLR